MGNILALLLTIWYFLALQTCLLAREEENAGCQGQACILLTSGPLKTMLCSRAERLAPTFLSEEKCLGCSEIRSQNDGMGRVAVTGQQPPATNSTPCLSFPAPAPL